MTKFNIALAYLTDTFGKLNDVNIIMKNPKVKINYGDKSVSALKDKLKFWKKMTSKVVQFFFQFG